MVYLGIGTNLGDREANLSKAITLLNADRINVVKQSSLYETAPQDVLNQPSFLNMVVECETRYFPRQLLTKLLRLERNMGRDRGPSSIRRGPRLIDIDILLYKNAIIQTDRLTIPHPRMLERRFVLEPLLEIARDLRHPATKQLLSRALAAVRNQKVTKIGKGQPA